VPCTSKVGACIEEDALVGHLEPNCNLWNMEAGEGLSGAQTDPGTSDSFEAGASRLEQRLFIEPVERGCRKGHPWWVRQSRPRETGFTVR
jgi:hypothetical protein